MKKRKKYLFLFTVLIAPVLLVSLFSSNGTKMVLKADEESISGDIISNSQANWLDSTNATFVGNTMKATSPSFNWQTNKVGGNSTIDFKSSQSLDLSAFSDWKWEYLTFSTTTDKGIDGTSGNPQAKNSVSLVWGWTKEVSVIEQDANGTIIFEKQLTLDDTGIKVNGITDSNILSQFHYYCFDKDFRIITKMTETDTGVKFDFEIITKSPWGHDVDATFTYSSSSSDLKGEKYVTYGRTGSGTIDDTHNILMTMKVDNVQVSTNPSTPTTKYECKINSTTSLEKIDANESFAHSFEKNINFDDGQTFDIDLIINDNTTTYGYLQVASFVDLSTNETKYAGSFYSQGNDNKIKINVAGNYKVIVNVTDSNEVSIDLKVNSYNMIDTAKKYHENSTNWLTLYNATVENSKMSQTGVPSLSISSEFEGNATVKFVTDYRKFGGSWGGVVYMLKGNATDFANTTWTFNTATNKVVPNCSNGSFIALCVTHGGYQLIVVDNGNVNEIGSDNTYLIPGVNGNSFWYICNQKTEITFDILDVENGVKLKISYYCSNTNTTYTSSEILLPYKSLWGKQSACISYVAGSTTPEQSNNEIRLYVDDKESSYSKDLYQVCLFTDSLNEINYESVTADNYASLVTKYSELKTKYDSLTTSQKELVSSADVEKLNKLKNDIENVDALVLAKLALEKLDEVNEDYNRSNYEEQSALVKDAITKYNLLTDTQKAELDETLITKLNKCKDDLENYEDILKYADPVVELINKISLPITNYAKDSRTILAASNAYNSLYEVEKNEVTNYSLLQEALVALEEYENANKVAGYNFATSLDNFVENDSYKDMTIKDGYLVVNSSYNNASIYTTAVVANEKEITWLIDSNLSKCSWGNFYFIIRSDSTNTLHNNGNWLDEGNYTVLLIGSDGLKIVECIDGVIPMTTDAFNNPIADYKTILDYPTDEEGSQNDIHYIYKNYTKIVIKTIDMYENDKYIGYKVIISLTGGDSGKTFVREYISENAHSENARYFGLETYVQNPINEGTGGFAIKGLYIESIDSYDGLAVKENIANLKIAKECDELLAAVITDVNNENLESAKNAYQAAKDKYDSLTEAQKTLLTVDVNVLNTAKNAIEEVENQIPVNPDLPSDIPSDVPSENPSDISSNIQSDSDKTSDDTNKSNNFGCKGSIASSISLVAIIGLLFLKKKKR